MCSPAKPKDTAQLGNRLRVKYADATLNRMFEGNQQNLAQLLRIWTAEVIKRGRARRWVPENTAWDAAAAQALYQRVAEKSLAQWLDGKYRGCSGSGVKVLLGNGICTRCKGTGVAPVYGVAGESQRSLDVKAIGESYKLINQLFHDMLLKHQRSWYRRWSRQNHCRKVWQGSENQNGARRRERAVLPRRRQ